MALLNGAVSATVTETRVLKGPSAVFGCFALRPVRRAGCPSHATLLHPLAVGPRSVNRLPSCPRVAGTGPKQKELRTGVVRKTRARLILGR